MATAFAPPPPPPPPDPLLPRDEAAAYIGVRKQTLAAWATSGRYELPYIKVGHLAKYRQSALDAWLASRERTHTGDAD